MRMPHLMLIVVLFLGFITLLAHKPQGDKAFADEPIFIRSKKVDTAPPLPGDLVRLCGEQARAGSVTAQEMDEFIEECVASRMINEASAE